MKFFQSQPWKLIALFIVSAFVLVSCQKEKSISAEPVSDEEAVQYSEESTAADGSFEETGSLGLDAAMEMESEDAGSTGGRLYLFADLRLRIGHCATITVEPKDSSFPKKVIIDFGDGCLGPDGKFRRGAMIIDISAPLREKAATATISFRDFYLNRAHVEGRIIYTNESANGARSYSVKVEAGAVTFPNGRGYSYEGVKLVTQVRGMETKGILDDVYSIEGRSKTVYANGKTVVLNTVDPLIKKVSCWWISEGTVKIVINDREFRLDYGFPSNGGCDNKALLSWNNGNDQKIITLP